MGFIKFSKYQGLHLTAYKNLIEDTSINSPDYFRITQFPEKLTCGRNAFLLAGNHMAFEPMSEIKFECVAQDGSNVYMEVPSWVDGSNNRMIVLYVYPWTVQGNGIITLVGKLRKTGATVRWKRLIQIDPFAPNQTPLVFGRKPKAFVQEKRKEYLNQTWPVGDTAEQTYSTGQISLATSTQNGVQTTIATLTGGATFTSDMVGGHLVIPVPAHNLASNNFATVTIATSPQVYDGYISEILTDTTAIVNHPYELVDVTITWTGFLSYLGSANYPTYLSPVNASDYTLDYIQTPLYTTGSGNYESYALVTISNLEPISGDADKVITYMRSAGFTEWEKIGDDNLNHKELLIDGGSHELTRKMGYFVDDYAKNNYWSSSAHGYNNSGDYPNLSRQSSSLMDAMRISGSEQFTETSDRSNSYIRVNVTNPVDFYADNEYQISFKFHRKDDLFDGFPAELVVYMSGSAFDNVDQNGLKTDMTLGKQITTLGEENTFSTWQAQVAAIQAEPNFVAGTIFVGSYQSNPMFEASSMANNPGGNAAGPVFQGSSVSAAQAQESSKNFWTAAGANIVPDPETQTYTFKADNDGTGVPVFQVKAGIWDISKVSVKAVALPGFTPNHTFLLSHIPSEKIEDLLDFKWEFYDGLGNKSNTFLVTHSMNFSGSNTYIEDALLPGTFNIGQSYAGTGFQFSGKSSAMIRTMGPDYPGFSQATGSGGGGGIIMWSGSIGAEGKEYAGQPYYGVGMELVGSSSWLRFRTQTGSNSGAGGELDITTDKFFLGSKTSFLSGSGDGTIAISSSNFELSTGGDVTMQGTITAEAGGTVGGWDITANTIEDLNGSGKGVKLTSDPSTPKIEIIKHSTDDYIKLYHTTDSDWGIIGREGGNNVFLLGNPGGNGNRIAGWTFTNQILDSIDSNGGIKLDSYNKEITVRTGSSVDSTIVSFGRIGGTVGSPQFGMEGLDSTDSSKILFKLGEAGNEIAGWTIDNEKLTGGNLLLHKDGYISSSNNWHISSSTNTSDPAGFISSSAFKVSADGRTSGSQVLFTGGKISGWSFDENRLYSFTTGVTDKFGISIDADYQLITFHGEAGEGKNNVGDNDRDNVRLALGQLTTNEFGIRGWSTGNGSANTGERIFELSSLRNEIAGWTFDNEKFTGGNLTLNKGGFISSSNSWHISSSTDSNDPVGFISSSAFKVSADGRMTASAGKIAGWKMNGDELQSLGYGSDAGIRLDGNISTPQILVRRDDDHYIKIHYTSAGDNGFVGHVAGANVFQVGSTNQIAGWTFDYEKLTGANVTISSSGEIKTSNFISSMVGGLAGAGYRIGADGIAEFEEARIRGTLSTAVFEKETVSAVGGALIVANATAIASGSLILSSSLVGQDTPSSSFAVDNAAGFAVGEYILAKATSSNGFTEEVMEIASVDTANNILVMSRSRNDNLIVSMSAGQVLVSQGKKDTGFILLNATSGSTTPYIDIAERTGSGVNDLDIKVRLGDLSGISDASLPSISGYGLYTDNVFLKGTISSSVGNIGGWTIGSTLSATDILLDPSTPKMTLGSKATLTDSNAGLYMGTDGLALGASSVFKVTDAGVLTATSATITGDITVTNAGDFADVNSHMSGSQFYENFQAALDAKKWTTADFTRVAKTTTPDGTPYLGSMFNHGGSDGWTAGAIGETTFLRSQAPTMEIDLVVNSVTPSTFIGFVPANSTVSDINTDSNFEHLMEGILFQSNDIRVYSDINNDGTATVQGTNVLGADVWATGTDTFLRVRITLKPSGGARYEVYKDGDFTTPHGSYDTTANTREQLKPAIFIYHTSTSNQITLGQLGVGSPIQPTRISGNSISTGQISSSNWGASAGSLYDLNAGTIKLGGSSNPLFQVNTSGHVSASAGNIGGFAIGTTALKGGTSFQISSSLNTSDPASFISSSAFKVSSDGRMTASAGLIGGVTIGKDSLNNSALFTGTGTWGNSNTGFFVNEYGTFSLKDKLTWDGTTLNVVGSIQVTTGAENIKEHTIFARGSQYDPSSTSAGNAVVQADNLTFRNEGSGRGLTLNILSESAAGIMEERYQGLFDTYGDKDTQCDNIAAILTGSAYTSGQSLEKNDVVVLTSFDAIKWNQNLVDAIKTAGGTNPRNRDVGPRNTWSFTDYHRSGYAFIGQSGSGAGAGMESTAVHQSTTTDAEGTAYYKAGKIYTQAGGSGTQISGDKIKTGNIESNNWGIASGSQLNLDDGTITLGGSLSSSFAVTSTGLVSATNFSEKFVTVNSGNTSQYYVNYSSGGNKTRIICDGSQGGDVTLNMQLDEAPDYIIGDILLPSQGVSVTTRCRLIINCEGVTMDETVVYQSSQEALAVR